MTLRRGVLIGAVTGPLGAFWRGRLAQAQIAEGYNHLQLQPVIHVAPDARSAKGRWRAVIQVGELGKTARWGGPRVSLQEPSQRTLA